MALVAVMACCMAASAYYESLPTVLEGSDGKRYIGTTILYEDGTNRFRGSAWVQTEDSSRVPLGTIGCRSGLAYGDSGQIFCETDWVWNPSTDYFKSSVTPQQYSNRSVFAVGWGKIDRELDCYFASRYEWYGRYYRPLQLMNFLRILQYAHEPKVIDYLKHAINEQLKEF